MLLLIASCVALFLVEEAVAPTESPNSAPGIPAQSEGGHVLTRWTTWAGVRSAGVADDGEQLYGAIGGGTVCTFEDDGLMVADLQVSESAVIVDGRGHEALAATAEGLEVLDMQTEVVKAWSVRGVKEAVFRERGAVALTASSLSWLDEDSVVAELTVGGCSGLSMDREGDVAWLACGGSLVAYEVDDARAFTVEGGVSRATWSPGLAGLFVVSQDGSTLRGLTAEGAELWATDVGGVVLGVAQVGGSDAAAALVDGPEGVELRLYEGGTGALLDWMPTDAREVRSAYTQPVVEIHGGQNAALLDVELGE